MSILKTTQWKTQFLGLMIICVQHKFNPKKKRSENAFQNPCGQRHDHNIQTLAVRIVSE